MTVEELRERLAELPVSAQTAIVVIGDRGKTPITIEYSHGQAVITVGWK